MIGFQSNNGMGKVGSGWHGDGRIERLARLHDTKTDHQEFAHGSDDDLLGFEAARFLEASDKSCNGGIETHCGQRRHIE
jgi:hypothetical protein